MQRLAEAPNPGFNHEEKAITHLGSVSFSTIPQPRDLARFSHLAERVAGPAACRLFHRLVCNRVELPVPRYSLWVSSRIQGARPAPAKHGQLVTRLIHGAVPVDPLGNGQRRAFGACGGNQFRCRARTEAGKVRGVVPGRKNLQHAQPFFPSATKANALPATMPIFTSFTSLMCPSAVKNLIELWGFGLFHVDDRQALACLRKRRRRCARRKCCGHLRMERARCATGLGCARFVTSKTFIPS